MRLRTSVDVLRGVLFAAIGVGSLPACGGSTDTGRSSPDDGTGGRGTDGDGGASTSGGSSGASSSGGGGVAGRSTGGTGGIATPKCEAPTPVKVPGTTSEESGGFVQCSDGTYRRPTSGKCPSSLDSLSDIPTSPPDFPSALFTCRSSKECTAKPYGYCSFTSGPGGFDQNVGCHYGCVVDSDCAAGEACLCANPIGTCIKADCANDSGCPGGTSCVLHSDTSGCLGRNWLACGFDCNTDADCAQYYKCSNHTCVGTSICGRPFLIDGAARQAGVIPRADWSSRSSPDLRNLTPGVRVELAAHWQHLGALEHASIGAFARFVLELLSLGAPSELVGAATQALADETEHARLCFGLASAYAGKTIGPAELPIEGALSGRSRTEIARNAFLEACVGETCAAIEALEAAERASDPAVRSALKKIAADETRHAELGFRFVKWALDTMNDVERAELLSHLENDLERQRETTRRAPLGSGACFPSTSFVHHGFLPPTIRRAAVNAAFDEVVLPVVDALFNA